MNFRRRKKEKGGKGRKGRKKKRGGGLLLTCTYVAINPTLNLRIVNSKFFCDLSNSSDERLHPALTQAFPIMSLCLSSLNKSCPFLFFLLPFPPAPDMLVLHRMNWACQSTEHAKVQSICISASSMWWPYHYMRKYYEQTFFKKRRRRREESPHHIDSDDSAHMLCCADQAIFQAWEMPQRPDNKPVHAGKQFG